MPWPAFAPMDVPLLEICFDKKYFFLFSTKILDILIILNAKAQLF
jgi:hypothetical protein